MRRSRASSSLALVMATGLSLIVSVNIVLPFHSPAGDIH
jgi:hypothetical protein